MWLALLLLMLHGETAHGKEEGVKRWHDNLSCGVRADRINGLVAECDPDSIFHCCNRQGECVRRTRHTCNCKGCFDYKDLEPGKRYRKDGKCGLKDKNSLYEFGMGLSECDPKGDKHCCNLNKNQCGNGDDCVCWDCIDYADIIDDKRCEMRTGDGNGKIEIPMQNSKPHKEVQCVDICLARQYYDPSITGVTIGFDVHVFDHCWCEQEMTEIRNTEATKTKDRRFKSCLLPKGNKKRYKCDKKAKNQAIKKRCGWQGVKREHCIGQLRCCWDDTVTPNCYHGLELEEREVASPVVEKIERGYRIMNETLAIPSRDVTDEFTEPTLVNGLADGITKGIKECNAIQECKAKLTEVATNLGRASNAFSMVELLVEGVADIKKFVYFEKILKSIKPFVGAIAPLLDLLATFHDSSEVNAITELKSVVTQGFTRMEERFEALTSQLDVLTAKVDFTSIETLLFENIQKLSEIRTFVNVYRKKHYPDDAAKNVPKTEPCDDDKKLLKNHYHDAFQKILNIGKIFIGEYGNDPLCSAYSRITVVNREAMLERQLRQYTMMVRGVSAVLQIAKLGNVDINDIDIKKEELTECLEKTLELIQKCDKDVTERQWKEQWKEDVRMIALEKSDDEGQASGIREDIYNNVSSKYYWRRWMVLVIEESYVEDTDTSKYIVFNDEEDTYFWETKGKYKILVASVDREYLPEYVDMTDIRLELKKNTELSAKAIFDRIEPHYKTATSHRIVGVMREPDKDVNAKRNLVEKAKYQGADGYFLWTIIKVCRRQGEWRWCWGYLVFIFG